MFNEEKELLEKKEDLMLPIQFTENLLEIYKALKKIYDNIKT